MSDKQKNLKIRRLNKQSNTMYPINNDKGLPNTDLPEKQTPMPEIKLGKYADIGYFKTNYNGKNLEIEPTPKNPQNAVGYRQQLEYLAKLNPEIDFGKIAYKNFGDRSFAMGGELQKYYTGSKDLPQYLLGGDCGEPGQPPCNESLQQGPNPDGTNMAEVANNTSVGNGVGGNEFTSYLYTNNAGTAGAASAAANAATTANTTRAASAAPNSAKVASTTGATLETNPTASAGTVDSTSELEKLRKENQELRDKMKKEEEAIFQFNNHYSGVDTQSGAMFFGQAMENKDATGIALGGLRTAAGIGRNIASGVGYQKRYNQTMEDYYKKQQDSMNTPQVKANGGELYVMEQGGQIDDYKMSTGEYMKGNNPMQEGQYNAEIEKGEYFQTNEGDVAEVVGKKHSQGGEKIQMQPEDRVLSDKLKLGAKTAKSIKDKYDIKVKATHTYSDVLDKLRKKLGLDEIVAEEAAVLKKIDEQRKIKDASTRDMNLGVLSEKIEEIKAEKQPLEEIRKVVFDELYNIQEASKPKDRPANNNFQPGGSGYEIEGELYGKSRIQAEVEKIAREYGVPITKATEIFTTNYIDPFSKNSNYTYKDNEIKAARKHFSTFLTKSQVDNIISQMEKGDIYIPKNLVFGQPGVKTGKQHKNKDSDLYGDLTAQQAKESGMSYVYKMVTGKELDYNKPEEVREAQKLYGQHYKNKTGEDYIFRVDGKAGEDALSGRRSNSTPLFVGRVGAKKEGVLNTMEFLSLPEERRKRIAKDYGVDYDKLMEQANDPINKQVILGVQDGEKPEEDANKYGMFMEGYYPTPLPPTGLQGTMKPERRFDRINPVEIDPRPYLQDIREQQAIQMQGMEGLSPSAAAAYMANISGNAQTQESKIRNQIDTQNLKSMEVANNYNAQTQAREENAREIDRLAFENRTYMSQAKSDYDTDQYYGALQNINRQKYMDIYNMNLVNARDEDVYFDGRQFRRKTNNKDFYDAAKSQLT